MRATCDRCGRSRPVVCDTDGNGKLVDLTPPCGCAGKVVCRDCGDLFDGHPRSWYCPAHKIVRRRSSRRERDRAYAAQNREKIREKARRNALAAYDRNPEPKKRAMRLYQQRHRDRYRARMKAYREANRERLREYDRQRNAAGRNAERADMHKREREILLRARKAA
jgi:hypothetical protein